MAKTELATKAQGADLQTHEKQEFQSLSQRFTESVLREISPEAGAFQMSSHQKKLIQHTFVKLDITLKSMEVKRLSKRDANQTVPFKWENVNMAKLAQDIAATSSVGLDPMEKNHLHLVPYFNDKTNKYDITPIIGYRGTEIKALKFGLNIPDDIVVEVVFEKDVFKPIKKDKNNPIETYIFEESEDFDRGEIVGGFYYHSYENNPKKNKLRRFSLPEILKRKPDYASAEFWGGSKDEWKDGKKTGNKIGVEGWFLEMVYKTIFRAAHEAITIDSEKITLHIAAVSKMEDDYNFGDPLKKSESDKMSKEVDKKAAATTINIDSMQGDAISPIDKAASDKMSNPEEDPIKGDEYGF